MHTNHALVFACCNRVLLLFIDHPTSLLMIEMYIQDVEEPESGVPLRVPQWIEATVVCALTSGYAPPGAPETEIVHVVLRAHGIMAS